MRPLRNESGQSIILVSIIILSFLMFFSFAISTGLLINAKISVQAAADAAAYAGAATQARQLNAISYLNYDMRRQYKKFLFRNAFVGSMGSLSFPQNITGANTPDYDFPKRDYNFATTAHVRPMNVPVVCIPLTPGGTANDNCTAINLANTVAVANQALGGSAQLASISPITSALINNLQTIANLQQNLCKTQGDLNMFAVMTWLFRADPSPIAIQALLSQLRSQQNGAGLADAISSLVAGIGLFPRNIISRMRIDSLASFVNDAHHPDLGLEQIQSLEKDFEPAKHERSIQAYRSALANLNTEVFDPTLVKMDEMNSDSPLAIEDIHANFSVYLQQMSQGATNPDPKANVICAQTIADLPIVGAPIGVKLGSNSKPVTYAIKLRAFIKPHGLLFLPNSEPLELTAYAAAKPFGSRMGNSLYGTLNDPDFVKTIQPAAVNGSPPKDCAVAGACNVPLMKVGAGQSTLSRIYLAELFRLANPTGTSFTLPGILAAQNSAMAPTPEEVGHFNILPPASGEGEHPFEFVNVPNAGPYYQFYAPLFVQGSADLEKTVRKYVDQIFSPTTVGTDAATGLDLQATNNFVRAQILAYLNGNLNNPRTSEFGESVTFASIELPIAESVQKGNPSPYWLQKREHVLSSWAPTFSRRNASEMKFSPRFGYSVKFVSLRDLEAGGSITSIDEELSKVGH